MLTILTFYLKLDCDFLCEVRGQFSFQFYAFSKNVIQHLKYWHFFLIFFFLTNLLIVYQSYYKEEWDSRREKNNNWEQVLPTDKEEFMIFSQV